LFRRDKPFRQLYTALALLIIERVNHVLKLIDHTLIISNILNQMCRRVVELPERDSVDRAIEVMPIDDDQLLLVCTELNNWCACCHHDVLNCPLNELLS
jgi:hypothetical protein